MSTLPCSLFHISNLHRFHLEDLRARDDVASAACSFHSGILSPTAAIACFIMISPLRPYITCLSYGCMLRVGFRAYQVEDAHKLLMNYDHHFKEIEWLPGQLNFTMK